MKLLHIIAFFTAPLYSFQTNKPVDPQLTQKIKKVIRDNQPLHIGFQAHSLKTGQSISKNEHHLFLPASNTKLLTTLLALETLGSDYQFETILLTDGPLKRHTVQGNIYIKGSGDPTLTTSDLETLIKKLQSRGIRHITGDLCIDREDFDQEHFAPGLFINNIGYSWNPPISAFILDGTPLSLDTETEVFLIKKTKAPLFFNGTSLLKNLLKKYHITLHGDVIFKKAPENSVLLDTHSSEPLNTLLAIVMKNSDNLYADCLFKRIGAHTYGAPGTWQKGINGMKHFLHTKIDLEPDSFSIMDGAGRSRYNLLSSAHIIKLLGWAYKQPYFKLFMETFAHADGTLKDRMPTIASKIKAKTGSLSGVSGLLGYIEFDEDIIAFSIFTNGYISKTMNDHPCKTTVEDALCTILVNECYKS